MGPAPESYQHGQRLEYLLVPRPLTIVQPKNLFVSIQNLVRKILDYLPIHLQDGPNSKRGRISGDDDPWPFASVGV